ncbi:MAG: HAMP domain-containing protein [Alphaproteobacteria bacterium]|nr:HAMP domain-containing protein [Alphaproteobacteria bacterium]
MPRGRGWPIAMVLGAGFGLFVALAVGAELFIGYVSAQRTTYDLVRDRVVSTLDMIVERLRQQLQPVVEQAEFVAEQMAGGVIDPADPDRLSHSLAVALAGTPQVSSLAFVTPDLESVGVRRVGQRLEHFRRNLRDEPNAASAMVEMMGSPQPFWSEVQEGSAVGLPLIDLRTPVLRDGRFLGGLMSTISVIDLSRLLAEISRDRPERPFILYGHDYVLAHPGNMFGLPVEPTREQPLPRIAQFGDPVLANLWDEKRSRSIERLGSVEARFVDAPGGQRVVLYRAMTDYGRVPWIVGGQFMADEIGAEFRRLDRMVYAGLSVLAVAVATAAMLGRRLARPLRRLAEAAEHIRVLDLRALKPLPESPFREIDSAARAFNAMAATLSRVETYLPKRLVGQLMHRQGEVESEEREVTVLFTDIVGFTALSENSDARELAGMLNEHFSMVERCIEAEGGTLDKYIGDSVMAFWNAPDPQPDHAARACRAAVAIAAAMRADSARRGAAGKPVLRMRIGVHTGQVLVGNIGAPGRMNYTIVGDTVNAAQRLQALGRRFDDGAMPAIALASETTAAAAGAVVPMTAVGLRGLAGREKPIEVYRLA